MKVFDLQGIVRLLAIIISLCAKFLHDGLLAFGGVPPEGQGQGALIPILKEDHDMQGLSFVTRKSDSRGDFSKVIHTIQPACS